MSKKKIDFSVLLNTEIIINKVNELGEALLTETSHNFIDHGRVKIIDVATKSEKNYHSQAKSLPAIALIEVILAAHRPYNLVAKKLKTLKANQPNLKSFDDLNRIISDNTKDIFLSMWGFNDYEKYAILINIMDYINDKKQENRDLSDYAIMNNWAKNVNIYNYAKEGDIGGIKNVGLATVQHLRMTFGANTVKPDQRVIEVLNTEFNLEKLSQEQAIAAVEYIAEKTSKSALLIDQIFVLYGSGYYNKFGKVDISTTILNTVTSVAKKLKDLKVDTDIIAKSTNLSAEQILML